MYRDLPKPFFVLAPMDDVTDTVFRQIVADCAAPDLFFTEFANVDGLQSPGRTKLLKKLQHTDKDQPLVAQLWGLKPENFYKTAQEIAEGKLGTFVGIDLNMGCPAKSEVQNGACSALIKPENRQLAGDIIKATREGLAGRLPLSVKTRLGFNEIDMSWFEFLLHKELDMLTVHARTRKEMSKVPAHWEEIGKVRELRDQLAPNTLLVGNGDVESREQGEELANLYGIEGIMIGRGVFHDPFVFATTSPWDTISPAERLELYTKHVKLFAKTWSSGERPVYTLNKFCKIYVNGFDGAKELREQLMAATSTDELLEALV